MPVDEIIVTDDLDATASEEHLPGRLVLTTTDIAFADAEALAVPNLLAPGAGTSVAISYSEGGIYFEILRECSAGEDVIFRSAPLCLLEMTAALDYLYATEGQKYETGSDCQMVPRGEMH